MDTRTPGVMLVRLCLELGILAAGSSSASFAPPALLDVPLHGADSGSIRGRVELRRAPPVTERRPNVSDL